MGLFRIQGGSPDMGLAHTLHRLNFKLTLSAKNVACYTTFLSIDKVILKIKMVRTILLGWSTSCVYSGIESILNIFTLTFGGFFNPMKNAMICLRV